MTSPADGEVDLFLPTDWYDLLADGPAGPEADAEARERFTALVSATLPNVDAAVVEDGTATLMAWRAAMLDRGMISHGVVNCPLDPDPDGDAEPAPNPDPGADPRATQENGRWASWHVLTGIVEFPAASPDLDLGELLARLLGQRLDPGASHLESFPTEIGCGTGLLMQPELAPAALVRAAHPQLDALPERPPTAGEAPRYGLAVAAASPPGGGTGLLVTGVCLDPSQLLELAGLVAVIAGRSRFAEDAAAR